MTSGVPLASSVDLDVRPGKYVREMAKLRFSNEAELQDAVAVFLQQAPLYQALSYTTQQRDAPRSIPGGGLSPFPSSISYDCPACRKETTWTQTEQDYLKGHDGLCHLVFTCMLCGRNRVSFNVLWEWGDNTSVRKVGQFPAWSIAVPAAVERALPLRALPFYKKGLICLSQNFGLGAVAYFRRTVEEIVGDLLSLVEQAASLDPTNRDEAALAVVESARRSHQASDRLKMIAPHLPAHLRVGGANPLARLYEKYSEGVHSLTDEESIDVAVEMRAILDYVLPALTDQLAAARAYVAALPAMRRVLEPPAVAAGEAPENVA